MGCVTSRQTIDIESEYLNSVDGKKHNFRFTFKVPQTKSMKVKSNKVSVVPTRTHLNHECFDYVSILGIGGFGTVLLCKNKISSKEYAMKVIPKHTLHESEMTPDTFVNSKNILKNIRHPFVSSIQHAFQTDFSLIMVFSYDKGISFSHILHSLAKDKLKLSIDIVLYYTKELISVVSYLHTHGIMHRDIKPANILLNANGHIELIDFDSAVCFNMELYSTLKHNTNNTHTRYAHPHLHPHLQRKKSKSIPCDINDECSFVTTSRSRYVHSTNTSVSNFNSSSNNSINMQYSKYADRRYTYVGTLGYMAPEIVKYEYQTAHTRLGYNHMVDWYSVGVTIYKFIFQEQPYALNDAPREPYYNRNIGLQYVNITQNMKEFAKEKNTEYTLIYTHTTDLLSGFMDTNPDSRLGSSIPEITTHPLFLQTYPVLDWNKEKLMEAIPPNMPFLATKYRHRCMKSFLYRDFEDMEFEMQISTGKNESEQLWRDSTTMTDVQDWDYNV